MKVFIDTSFFVEYFLGNEKAKEIYEKLKLEDLYTLLDVVKETTYIIMKFTASDVLGIEKHYEILKGLKESKPLQKVNLSIGNIRNIFKVFLLIHTNGKNSDSW